VRLRDVATVQFGRRYGTVRVGCRYGPLHAPVVAGFALFDLEAEHATAAERSDKLHRQPNENIV
jgi:hypothetical protein